MADVNSRGGTVLRGGKSMAQRIADRQANSGMSRRGYANESVMPDTVVDVNGTGSGAKFHNVHEKGHQQPRPRNGGQDDPRSPDTLPGSRPRNANKW